MTVQFKKVYRFDLDRVVPIEIPIDDDSEDFNEYLHQLIEAVLYDDRSKKYLFPEDPPATMGIIENLVSEQNMNDTTLDAARRLLRIEVAVQGRIEHLEREVQKGIMVQALVENDNQLHFLIIKAEHAEFINESDNRRATGLPIKKKIFKAFCAYIGPDGNPTHAKVSDYRTIISAYWWRDFLELVEEYTDAYNTERAFDVLDSKVFNRIKRDHPADHMILRNATVQYFRGNAEFVMADYLNTVFDNYAPEDETLDIAALSRTIRQLPERGKFDERFGIVREKLKKRIIKRLKLTSTLELVIKEDIDMNTDVSAFIEGGVKYIKIRTDEGYKFFKKEE